MLIPLGNKVIIEITTKESKTDSGILIPTKSQEKSQYGTIISKGVGNLSQDGERVPLEVKEGDKVIYSKYAGVEVEHNSKQYLILQEKDILAIIK